MNLPPSQTVMQYYYYYFYFFAYQHKTACRKTRLDTQNYGCNGNLLYDHGVVERNCIFSLESHGKALMPSDSSEQRQRTSCERLSALAEREHNTVSLDTHAAPCLQPAAVATAADTTFLRIGL